MRVDQMMRVMAGLLLLLATSSLLAGPEIERWETSNGTRVHYVAAPELPMVDLRVVFDAGSARDAIPGVGHLTNSLLEEGAGEWDADRIAERLEGVGAEMSTGSMRDMAWVSLRSLTEEGALETAIQTLTQVLGSPRFEDEALERLRKTVLVSLNHDDQSPASVAKKTFMQEVFGEHPYAAHSEGTRASVEQITREDVLAHYRQYYVASNALIAIVGAVDRQQAESLAERVASGLAEGSRAPVLPPVADLQEARMLSVSFPSSQSHILMGQPGMHRGDSDYFVLYVGNHILGGSGLVSQLSEEVREKRGLSYSVYSYFSPMRRNGPFLIGAQTQNAKAEEALQVMRDTLQRFMDQGPTEQELEAAKQNITGGFPLRIASNSKILEYIAMIGFYDLPLDYLDRFVERVESVTTDQIRDAFQRRIKPHNLVTVVVGNDQKTVQAD
ncbi:MAG: insulinase family protein [Sedimenticola sp.]|nr:insulinase family protein [Sedimenticola sp.]